MVLTEARMPRTRVESMSRRLNFDRFFATELTGFRGGIILLWNVVDITVMIGGHSVQEVHTLTEVQNPSCTWLFSGVYASPRLDERKILWENLKVVATANCLSWVVMGNFNEVLNNDENFGGGL